MNNSKYYLKLGATAACTKIMMEAIKGIGQRDTKGDTKGCFIFDSWFFSKNTEESAIDVGAEIIGMFKTNT